jgi:hypothetical protein
MLPTNGWMVIAYLLGNPGVWMLHCHIAWHVSGGLGMVFLERPASFKANTSAFDETVLNDVCSAWNAYFPADDPFPQDDSGLKARNMFDDRFKVTRLA